MRLLPRTRRGTWALAGALWLGVAAWAWWVAPNRLVAWWPRSVGTDLVGFEPGGNTLLVLRQPRDPDDPDGVRRLNRLDLRTGEVRELFALDENLTNSRLSPDGRSIALRLFIDAGERTALFDAVERRWTDIARGGHAGLPVFQFSPTGRYLAFAVEDDPKVRGLRVWDVTAGRDTGSVAVASGGWQMIHDYEIVDGWLVVKVCNGDGPAYLERILVYSGPPWQLRHTFELPPGHDSGPPRVYDDGTLAAHTGPRGGASFLQTWELATGRHLKTEPESAEVKAVEAVSRGVRVPGWLDNAVLGPLGLKVDGEVVALSDPDTGNRIGVLKPSAGNYDERWNFLEPDDGLPLVALGDADGVHVWHYPPRRSWRWLAAVWAGSGFALGLLAAWRVRRLKQDRNLSIGLRL